MTDEPSGVGAREVAVNPLDLQANERTYLAWTRTALTLFSIGIAFHLLDIDLGRFSGPNVLSVIMMAMGLLNMVYGMYRYRHRRHQLERGLYGADNVGPAALGVVVICVTVAGVWIVLQ